MLMSPFVRDTRQLMTKKRRDKIIETRGVNFQKERRINKRCEFAR